MASKDVREFLYANLRASPRFRTEDEAPAPGVLARQRDERVIALLNQLGERLIRSERERLEMKSLLEQHTGLGDELRARQDKLEQDYASQMQKIQKAVILAEKIEEALIQQNRLAGRVEQIVQDKARMLRKLERIEETVIETQSALNSKSLVLLTGEGGAGGKVPADPSATAGPAANENRALLPRVQARHAVALLLILLAGGLTGGALYKMRFLDGAPQNAPTQLITATPAEPVSPLPPESVTDPAVEEPVLPADSFSGLIDEPPPAVGAEEAALAEDAAPAEEPPAPAPAVPDAPAAAAPLDPLKASDDELINMLNQDPDALAAALNDIAPGAVGEDARMAVAETLPETPAAATAANDGEFSVKAFLASQQQSAPLKARLQPDPSLPAPLQELEVKAFEGLPAAQHDLAALYVGGHRGLPVDYNRAAQWFREAAAGGVANAQYNLGVLYHQGLGVRQDINQAVSWYRAAAAQNHPEAEYNLAIAYIEGVGAPYNPHQASRYFEMAARHGVLEAAYNLGLIHENGLMGRATPDDALFWYRYASDMGSPEAKAALDQLARTAGYDQKKIDSLYDARATKLGLPAPGEKAAPAPKAPPAKETPAAPAKKTAVESAPAIPVLPLEEEEAAAPSTQTPAPAVKTQSPAARAASSDPATVAQIQEYLFRAGLYPGPVDGTPTDMMGDSIRAYQRLNGLKVDGRASDALLVHMLTNTPGKI